MSQPSWPCHARALSPIASMLASMLMALMLGACTKEEKPAVEAQSSAPMPFGLAADSGSPAPAPFAPRFVAGAAAFAAADPPRSDTLAYEHTASIELTRELLSRRLDEIQAACRTESGSACTLLDVSVNSHQRVPSGSIRMRLAPGGVESMIETAAQDGRVVSRSTHAEDLAQPVADTERQLALLTTHRQRLEELMNNRNLSVDQLITVSRELASVQSQIEQLSTTRANLRRRIDTELLTIHLSVPDHEFDAQQSPIMDALRSFGSDVREAFAGVIRFVAAILPWLIVIVPAAFASRWLWRRLKRA